MLARAGGCARVPASRVALVLQVLHLSPHPDDELIGAPATLMALRDAGATITNFACSLGSDPRRRRLELTSACARARFELLIADIDYFESARSLQAEVLLEPLIKKLGINDYDLIVAPSPHDGHPAHEMVGRIAVRIAEKYRRRLWLWGTWADLPLPNIVSEFSEERLEEILGCLALHRGELERNDYSQLIIGSSRANARLASERVFGFGAAGLESEFAEVCTEVLFDQGRALLGASRLLDPEAPLSQAESSRQFGFRVGRGSESRPGECFDISAWLYRDSLNQLLASPETSG